MEMTMTSPIHESVPEHGSGTARHLSPPPPGLRQRPLSRAATFADSSVPSNRRRSSIFSESLSDARKSLKSSTEDLLAPRISTSEHHDLEETSHWHSLPLGLALLPAVGGLFFTNGGAIITDITLLALAAIFMSWSLRTPWDWYHDSQSLDVERSESPTAFSPIAEEDENQLTEETAPQVGAKHTASSASSMGITAQQELRIHELFALTTCFVAPVLAAWLLHAIRAQLSRPSEGLVSNYNLSIFLLVAEIRPMSHMIKMIQQRTMFLQRKVNSQYLQPPSRGEGYGMEDLVSRIEELEVHIASRIEESETSSKDSPDSIVVKASSQASTEVRRTVQPELDALGRAMRRYEKRTTVSTIQVEARLQELEASLKDVVVLAAAAQRTVEQQPNNYIHVLANWTCALVVIPLQALYAVLTLPSKLFTMTFTTISNYLPLLKLKKSREAKQARRMPKSSLQEREKRSKGS